MNKRNLIFRLLPALTLLTGLSVRAQAPVGAEDSPAVPVELLAPADRAVVPLLTPAQKAFLALPRAERREKYVSEGFRRRLATSTEPGRKAYWPEPVRLTWKAEGNAACDIRVTDAKTGDCVYEAKGVTLGAAEVDNLEIARDYRWQVTVGGVTAEGRFTTEGEAPRFIRYPGVPNVRDFGGRLGLGGKRIRQGLVIRSAGLNENAKPLYCTREELEKEGKLDAFKAAAKAAGERLVQLRAWQADPGTMDRADAEYAEWCARHRGEPVAAFLSGAIKAAEERVAEGDNPKVQKGFAKGASRVGGEKGAYIRARFGLRTDIDLRSDRECYGMTASPLGPSVRWEHISSAAYDGMQSKFGREAFTKVFRLFLDEKNYPIDFHCIAGQDRTGSLAYILGSLLGVSEEELELDWEVTAFWNHSVWFRHEILFDKLLEGFEKAYPEAATPRARVEAYVLSLGFTAEDIAKFRRIMLED